MPRSWRGHNCKCTRHQTFPWGWGWLASLAVIYTLSLLLQTRPSDQLGKMVSAGGVYIYTYVVCIGFVKLCV